MKRIYIHKQLGNWWIDTYENDCLSSIVAKSKYEVENIIKKIKFEG